MTDQPIPREEIERWRSQRPIVRREMIGDAVNDGLRYVEEQITTPAVWRRLLATAEAHLSEPARIAAARREGESEMRDFVVRLAEDLRGDMRAKMASSAGAADRERYRHFEEAFAAFSDEIKAKTIQVFDVVEIAHRAGYREGIEAAARALAERVKGLSHIAATSKRQGTAEHFYTRAAAVESAEAAIRALAPPPTWPPTHRHYKGGLYRELMRADAWTDLLNPEPPRDDLVVFENEAGRRFILPALEFDEMVVAPATAGAWSVKNEVRRFQPIQQPEEPTDAV